MYPNVRAEFARKGLTLENVSKEMKIGIGTLSTKMRGVRPFTVKEAKQIKKITNSKLPLEELFATEAELKEAEVEEVG